MILWGENALIQYRIPAAVIVSLKFNDRLSVFIDLLHRQRDDIAVPSDLLDDAAAALQSFAR
jgi:hypothetical protein